MTLTAAPVEASPTRPPRLRHLPGLDGLRAIAVVAVIVYHLKASWLPGGYLGVDVFFVISGYLITSLLLAEWGRSGGIALVAFWRRRARRLLPALVVLLLVVTLLASFAARDGLSRLRGDVPASLFYVMNWRLLAQHDSYLASLGRPPLLQHLWSLAVEEQFYLLWPLALIFFRHRIRNSRLALVAAGGAVVSALLMAVLFRSGTDPSVVYFGTETHAEGLLIGCALAAAIPPWRMAATVPPSARRVLERSGAAALAVVAVGMVVLGFDSPATYRGGMLVVDLATAVVVASVAHPASRLGSALSRQPLRWAGRRSYSLYLWHWPIFLLVRPGVDIAAAGWAVTSLRLGLTVGAAELSYRFVEQPWRTGRAQTAISNRLARVPAWKVTGAVVLPVATVIALLATAPAHRSPSILLEGSTAAARSFPASLQSPPAFWQRAQEEEEHGPAAQADPPTTLASDPLHAAEPILAVGDSVLLAASPSLTSLFGPQITVDAQVGRQVAAGLERLAAYRTSGVLSRYRTVVIDLGTNGVFAPNQFAQMTELLGGVPRVVVYDVHADRPWAATSNATITSGVAAHAGQMRMVDWNRAASTPALLYPDGIHPDGAGAQLYGQLLRSAVASS